VQINILGPLEAIVGGESIVPSATKPRKVLALLIANANHVVQISKLKFEIWDDNPPVSASTTLQTYVLQLRKLIGNAVRDCPTEAKDILVTRPNGYMFRTGPGQLDVDRYEQLAHQGNESLFLGDTETAVRQLREALSLWRGSALAGVELGQLLQAHVIRLKESRLHTVERRIEAELRLGNHQALLSELAVLVVEEPFNENIRAQFMLALYRSGRRTEALEAFRQLRALLIEEIGLEPSPRMYRLQQAMLTANPALDEAPQMALHSVVAA
jgi:SARP family transcriptional regulator, regulator of embCAB operon